MTEKFYVVRFTIPSKYEAKRYVYFTENIYFISQKYIDKKIRNFYRQSEEYFAFDGFPQHFKSLEEAKAEIELITPEFLWQKVYIKSGDVNFYIDEYEYEPDKDSINFTKTVFETSFHFEATENYKKS